MWGEDDGTGRVVRRWSRARRLATVVARARRHGRRGVRRGNRGRSGEDSGASDQQLPIATSRRRNAADVVGDLDFQVEPVAGRRGLPGGTDAQAVPAGGANVAWTRPRWRSNETSDGPSKAPSSLPADRRDMFEAQQPGHRSPVRPGEAGSRVVELSVQRRPRHVEVKSGPSPCHWSQPRVQLKNPADPYCYGSTGPEQRRGRI